MNAPKERPAIALDEQVLALQAALNDAGEPNPVIRLNNPANSPGKGAFDLPLPVSWRIREFEDQVGRKVIFVELHQASSDQVSSMEAFQLYAPNRTSVTSLLNAFLAGQSADCWAQQLVQQRGCDPSADWSPLLTGGPYRYRLSKQKGGSDRLGSCEVCNGLADAIYLQVEERFYRSGAPSYRSGWTQHNCSSRYGHAVCLFSVRRQMEPSAEVTACHG